MQEARLQTQARDMYRMREWMEESFAEARARDARIEASTEAKIQEAVEIERRTARAFSEERRRVHSEQVERRLRDDFRDEFRREAAAVATPLMERQGESRSGRESARSGRSSEALPPQGVPLTFLPLRGPAGVVDQGGCRPVGPSRRVGGELVGRPTGAVLHWRREKWTGG